MQNSPRTMSMDAVAAEQQRFMVRVYNWMAAGLGITGFMAYYVANTPTFFNIVMGNPIIPIVLIIAQIGLVFWLASRVMQMGVSQATGTFFLYAGLTGITFSTLFVVYTAASITSTFMVTAGTFGAMSFYGYTTKKDLTSWGSFFIHGSYRNYHCISSKHFHAKLHDAHDHYICRCTDLCRVNRLRHAEN